MKIYGVYIGNDYEDGAVRSHMFRIESDALMECAALARKYNDEHDDDFKLVHNDRYDNGWWRDGADYIHVMEYELI